MKFTVLVTFEVEAESQTEADGIVDTIISDENSFNVRAWLGVDPADITEGDK